MISRLAPILCATALLLACGTTGPTVPGTLDVRVIQVDPVTKVISGTAVNTSGQLLGAGDCEGRLQNLREGLWETIPDGRQVCAMYLQQVGRGRSVPLSIPALQDQHGCGYRIEVVLPILDAEHNPTTGDAARGASQPFCLP